MEQQLIYLAREYSIFRRKKGRINFMARIYRKRMLACRKTNVASNAHSFMFVCHSIGGVLASCCV